MKILKKIVVLILAMSLAFTVFFGCAPKKPIDNTPPPDITEPEKPEIPDDQYFSHFTKIKMGDDLFKIDLVDMTVDERLVAVSLQGILAQKGKASIYIDNSLNPDGTDTNTYWRTLIEARTKVVFKKANSVWELVEHFKADIAESGYILCDIDTVNAATMECSMKLYLMVTPAIKAKAEEKGLTKKIDCIDEYAKAGYIKGRDRDRSAYEEIIFDKYAVTNSFNKTMIIHQGWTTPNSSTELFSHLRDYAIATKSATFFARYPGKTIPQNDPADTAFCAKVFTYCNDDAPVLGWPQDEVSFIQLCSEYGKFTLASNWSYNYTILNSQVVQVEQKKYVSTEITPQDGKHYMAIVMSDGDNLQWNQNDMLKNPKWYGSTHRGKFPMSWTMAPTLADLAPDVIQGMYDAATAKDYFIAGASGQGYINPLRYPIERLEKFAEHTNDYLKKSDLQYTAFIDDSRDINTVEPHAMFAKFAKQDAIDGALWMFGDKYTEGRGGVFWENDKPLLSFRDGLWDTTQTPANAKKELDRAVANANSFENNYKDIGGYSLINVHPWSMDMDQVNSYVDRLNDNIELISVEQLMKMVTKHVPHVDKRVIFNENVYKKDEMKARPFMPLTNNQIAFEDDATHSGTDVRENLRDFAFTDKTVNKINTKVFANNQWVMLQSLDKSTTAEWNSLVAWKIKFGDFDKIKVKAGTFLGNGTDGSWGVPTVRLTALDLATNKIIILKDWYKTAGREDGIVDPLNKDVFFSVEEINVSSSGLQNKDVVIMFEFQYMPTNRCWATILESISFSK